MKSRDRFVTPENVDPAPAGIGFGMVFLSEVHHPEAPGKCRQPYWHAFGSREELATFLDAVQHATNQPGIPAQTVLLKLINRRRKTYSWHPLSKRALQDLRSLTRVQTFHDLPACSHSRR